MDLTDKAGRAPTRRAYSARGFLPTATIADLSGTDTKVVFVARHQTTIGSRTLTRKTGNAVRVMQRGNACASEIRPTPICSMSRATALGALKKNDNRKKRCSLIATERRRPTKNNVQTKT
jgi:hypothetical protein